MKSGKMVACASGVCLLVGFAWGFLSHRHFIFPYGVLRVLAIKSGITRPIKKEVKSHSRALELLQALPYVAGTVDANIHAKGVLLFDRGKTDSSGLNFYDSTSVTGLESSAYLIDMEGTILHRWSYSYRYFKNVTSHWKLVGNGDAFVLIAGRRLVKVDKESGRIWEFKGDVHHNFGIDEEGDIYVLNRRQTLDATIHPTLDSVDDVITILSAQGEKKGEISLLDAVRSSVYAFLLPRVGHLEFEAETRGEEPSLDVLHTNHVEVFDGSVAHRSAFFKKGNILVSMRNINLIAIIDGTTHEISWAWGPTNLTLQHHPRLLPNGNILLFNNRTDLSQIIEVNPLSFAVEWAYQSGDFFSALRGSCQRLQNGNTLITESDKGYVFEVTKEGEIVWKFANPEMSPDGERKTIWRMTRFTREELPFLFSGRRPAGRADRHRLRPERGS